MSKIVNTPRNPTDIAQETIESPHRYPMVRDDSIDDDWKYYRSVLWEYYCETMI